MERREKGKDGEGRGGSELGKWEWWEDIEVVRSERWFGYCVSHSTPTLFLFDFIFLCRYCAQTLRHF